MESLAKTSRPGSRLMRALLCLVAAAMPALHAGTARAQTSAESWPSRAITWVVPFGAGGVTDLVSRKIAELLRTRLGQPVVVENRPGAGGTIGTEFVARAQADGYTVLYASGGPMTIQPNLGLTKLNYDPLKSYVHVRGVRLVEPGPRRDGGCALQHAGRVRRLCEGQPWQAQFRLARPRHRAASRRRDVSRRPRASS